MQVKIIKKVLLAALIGLCYSCSSAPPPEEEAAVGYKELTVAGLKNDIEQTGQVVGADFNVRETDEGIAVVLYYFAADSALLTSESTKKLNDIIVVLAQYPPHNILVRGHTALAGSAAGRKAIAEERAKVVCDVLEANAIAANLQIESKGVAATIPLASDKTREGRRTNRRVEIVLLNESL